MTAQLKNPHPGMILKEEFLDELGLSQNALAKALDIPASRINRIVNGQISITADTDLRLSRYFGLSEGFWLGLQNDYDMMEAKRRKDTGISRIKPAMDWTLRAPKSKDGTCASTPSRSAENGVIERGAKKKKECAGAAA